MGFCLVAIRVEVSRVSSLLRSVRLGGSLQWVSLTIIGFRCESPLLTVVIFVLVQSHQGPSPLIRTFLKPHIYIYLLSWLGLKLFWKAASKNCGFGSLISFGRKADSCKNIRMHVSVDVAQVYFSSINEFFIKSTRDCLKASNVEYCNDDCWILSWQHWIKVCRLPLKPTSD